MLFNAGIDWNKSLKYCENRNSAIDEYFKLKDKLNLTNFEIKIIQEFNERINK